MNKFRVISSSHKTQEQKQQGLHAPVRPVPVMSVIPVQALEGNSVLEQGPQVLSFSWFPHAEGLTQLVRQCIQQEHSYWKTIPTMVNVL